MTQSKKKLSQRHRQAIVCLVSQHIKLQATMQIHENYMQEALTEAQAALNNGDFPVGCVMVHDETVVANGRRLHSVSNDSTQANELDHAEIVALRHLRHQHPEINPGQVTVYSTMEPCLMCFATLLVNGISNIVYSYEDIMGGGTGLRLTDLPPLYQEMTVTVTPKVLRERSLQMFKQFFSTNKEYLHDTLLARYTLAQGS